MKKTMVSLAAASLIATTAMAADKGIDIVTTGEATIYYQTNDKNSIDLFDQRNSSANVGVQLNLDADLKNNFSFGSQLTYLGTAGLEKNLVGGTRQAVTDVPNGLTTTSSNTNDIALTKFFVAKKVANTTVKIGRQELPKSLSPFAWSESWNVYKNTFDAILAVNTDIPKTVLVGAYVASGTGSLDLSQSTNLNVVTTAGATNVGGTAYMLTAQTTAVPMATITASYYSLAKVDGGLGADLVPNYDLGADVIWLDAKIAPKDLPMGLKFGLQGGSIMPDASAFSDTTAYGAKVGLKPVDALNVCLAFSSVSGEKDYNKLLVAAKNTTGVKTPLYTQMITNQNAIALDAQTFMLQAKYSMGDNGTVVARATATNAGARNLNGNGNDSTNIEVFYKVKAGGVSYFAGWFNTKLKDDNDAVNIARVWARYAF